MSQAHVGNSVNQSLYSRLIRRFEEARIRLNLKVVEQELQAVDIGTFPPERRRARKQNIARLREYRLRGVFPRNTDFPGKAVPYFRDRQGTLCAVGYLMQQSGESALLEDIVKYNNHLLVKDVELGPVKQWFQRSGLTQAEAARVQFPGYYETVQVSATTQLMPAFLLMTLMAAPYVFGQLRFGYLYFKNRWPSRKVAAACGSVFYFLFSVLLLLGAIAEYFSVEMGSLSSTKADIMLLSSIIMSVFVTGITVWEMRKKSVTTDTILLTAPLVLAVSICFFFGFTIVFTV